MSHTDECQLAMYRGPRVCICGAHKYRQRPVAPASRTIRVDDEVYAELEARRFPGESMQAAVTRIIAEAAK